MTADYATVEKRIRKWRGQRRLVIGLQMKLEREIHEQDNYVI